VVLAAFSAGADGVRLVDVVEVAAVAVASCPRIAGARPLPAVMQHGLSQAAPAVLILVVVVGVARPVPAAAAAAVEAVA